MDFFNYVLVTFFTRLTECVMLKRDVKSAFKKIPLKASHGKYSSVMFRHAGRLYRTTHRACNFGAVSSV